jgi:hypothetical protein
MPHFLDHPVFLAQQLLQFMQLIDVHNLQLFQPVLVDIPLLPDASFDSLIDLCHKLFELLLAPFDLSLHLLLLGY